MTARRRSATARRPHDGGRRAPRRGRVPPRRRGRVPPRRRGRLRAAAAGDRLCVLALFVLVVLLAAMAMGPLQSYTAAADRVDGLAETRDRLQDEVDLLEDRRERLHDPEEIELMARSELGLVKPGEVPFVVVTPEPELDRVHPDANQEPGSTDGAWYRRLGRWIGGLFR